MKLENEEKITKKDASFKELIKELQEKLQKEEILDPKGITNLKLIEFKIADLLQELSLCKQRITTTNNGLSVELYGYNDLYQILINNEFCKNLKNNDLEIDFYPYYKIGELEDVEIEEKIIKVENVYIKLVEVNPLLKNLVVFIDQDCTNINKKELKLEVLNMVFSELERAAYINDVILVEEKEEGFYSIGEFLKNKEEITLEELLSRSYVLNLTEKQITQEYRKEIKVLTLAHPFLNVDTLYQTTIKEETTGLDFITCKIANVEQEDLKIIVEDLKKLEESNYFLLATGVGEKVIYLDYLAFDTKELLDNIQKIAKAFEIKVEVYDNVTGKEIKHIN